MNWKRLSIIAGLILVVIILGVVLMAPSHKSGISSASELPSLPAEEVQTLKSGLPFCHDICFQKDAKLTPDEQFECNRCAKTGGKMLQRPDTSSRNATFSKSKYK